MTNLMNVSERVYSMSKDCHDELVPVKDVSFNGLGEVKIGSETHPMKPIAQMSIAQRLGIPHHYLKKCTPDLQAANMNHWIKHEKNEEIFMRFDGDKVRAIFTPRYVPVDNMEVMRKLEEMAFDPDTEVQCHLDSGFMLLNIPAPEQSFKIHGDEMTPGISISNSEVGLSSLALAAYILRLICTNGLVTTEEVMSARYRHISHKVLNGFENALSGISLNMNDQKIQLMIAHTMPVEDHVETFERFNRQYQLNEVERNAVEWAWPHEHGDRIFNIIQTYTRAAQHKELSADSSYKLQRTGGNILAMMN
ncbi:DUF932 domain-containing protein [Candidatus Pacearchaeota archaeon]|nr:DUF932 domain-containing protein [Candidatus Pacearchaeota archaeon]